jgi:hypothetical protein
VPFWTIVPGFMVISKIFQGFDHRKSSKSKQPTYIRAFAIYFLQHNRAHPTRHNTTQRNATQRNTDQSNLYSTEQHARCMYYTEHT